MRKITVGAIQPGEPPFNPRFDCLRETFAQVSVDEVVRGHCMPKLEITLALLAEAGQRGCGIVTTSEDVMGLSPFLTGDTAFFNALAEKTAAIAEQRFADLARRFHMYVIGCYFTREGDKNYNIATVFDRAGAVAGQYRKTHLPPNEMWQAVDGDELSVIPLDFGVIGISICYDMMFPESVQVLAMRGAEIIFHPTGGYGWYDAIGEATLKTRANDNSVPIVTAKNYIYNGAGHSSVIDYWGQVLADAGFYENAVVTHTLDLDVEKRQPDWFYPTPMSGEARVGVRKLAERRPSLYTPLTEDAQRLKAPTEAQRAILRQKIKNNECHW